MDDLLYLLGMGIVASACVIVLLTLLPLRPGPSLSRKGAPPEERKNKEQNHEDRS